MRIAGVSPCSGRPWISVLQVSPAATGCASVSVPGGDDLACGKRRAPRAGLRAAPTRCPSASSGLPSTMSPRPRSTIYAVLSQSLSLEARKQFAQIGHGSSAAAGSHDQAAVQAVAGGAVGELELPARVVALHDLDGVRDPLDALEQDPPGLPSAARRLQAEADLGLDARLRQAGERHHATRCRRRADQRAVVDRAPDRLVDAVARPDAAVGEADLAADRFQPRQRGARAARALRSPLRGEPGSAREGGTLRRRSSSQIRF